VLFRPFFTGLFLLAVLELGIAQPIAAQMTAPAITSTSSTTFTVGSTGTFTVTATGTPVPTLSQTGTLPAGVSFNAATGVLSGTPAIGTGGIYPITLTAQNGVAPNAAQNFTLTVNEGPAFIGSHQATFAVGTAGTFTVTATGFPAPAISGSGTLPTGVTFNPVTDVLSGTPVPRTGGIYNIALTAQNGVAASASETFTLFVDEPAAIASANSAVFAVNTPGSFTVAATGFPAPVLSEIGTLPAGFTFNASSGVLSTPAGTGGTYPLTFIAHNGFGPDALQSFTLMVNQAPAITGNNSTTFAVGTAGTFTVAATGTPAPTLSQTGTLPAGVSFDAATGVLSGTPAAGTVGTYAIALTAQNGIAPNATQSFTLTVNPPVNQAPTITGPSSTTFTVGSTGTFTVTVAGNPASSLSETGVLPAGVSFNTATGVLSGTPATGTGGNYAITLTAQNGIAPNATQSFTLTVNERPAFIPPHQATFLVGTARTFTVTATGFPVPGISGSGAWPAGVTFNPVTDVLSGTPVPGTGGIYNIALTAQNGVTGSASEIYTVFVDEPAAITSANSAVFAAGASGTFTVTGAGFPVPVLSEIGTLPAGFTFNAASGFLSGTPAAGTSGAYPLTFRAHNGIGPDALQTFTLTVNQAITSASGTTFTVGVAGTFIVTATGIPAPALSETGILPAGVSFNTATGVLSGTPATGTGGNYAVTLTAQNGVAPNATQNFTLTVNERSGFSGPHQATFLVGTARTFTLTTTGFPVPEISGSGAWPAGVTFNPVTDVLSGTPVPGTGGIYNIALTAQNGVAASASEIYTVFVDEPAAIASANSAVFAVNAPGSFTVAATGFPAPVLSEIGTLPAGFTFNAASGVLSTPAAGISGTYPLTFRAHNGIGPDALQSFTLTVNQAPAITSASGTTFTIGSAGTFTVTATGTPVPTLSQTGTLPAGVSFNAATGVFSGTPAAGTAGTYPITLTAQNGVPPNATQNFTLTVNIPVNQAPTITSTSSTTFTVGSAGSFTVTATGGPVPTLSQTGTLPAGVSFNTATGVLSGTPATGTGGNYAITLTARNRVAPKATQNFALTVNERPAFSGPHQATFKAGTAGAFTVMATGFPVPEISGSGAWPAGVTFNPVTDVLSGTPVPGTGGIYNIALTAQNGVAGSANEIYTVFVDEPAAIASANSAVFAVNTPGSFTVAATGFPAPVLSETGTLPAGFIFNAASGVLSTPAAGISGTYPITFRAHNGVDADALQTFSLLVVQGSIAPSFASPNSANFIAGTAGSFVVTAAGVPTPALSETGNLPMGVTFNISSGVLSGTPALGTTGIYPITFSAANGVGSNAIQNFTLTVNSAPAITAQPSSQTVTVNQAATFTVTASGSAPLSYQWQRNGANILGANSSIYTTPATTGADDGAQYAVIVGNSSGSASSFAVTLTVNSPPSITGQPVSQTVAVGEAATFSSSVSVTGALPLSYQWFKNNASIPGATSPSYTTPVATQPSSGDQFTVAVANSLGSALSSAATLTVVPATSPATYYVDFASGSDINNGLSRDRAWQYAPGMDHCSFNCALIGLQPGDKVIFKGGVEWDVSGFPMVVSSSGASGNPIYYGVDQTWFAGNTWTRPVFDLNNSIWSVAPILVSSANFVTFDNLEIENEEVDNTISWPPRSSIAVDGGSNITIQNCYIHGWSIQNPGSGSDYYPSGGIAFYDGSAGGVVKNCVLDGSPSGNSGAGIYGGTSIQQNVVENVPNGIVVTDPSAEVSGNQVFNISDSSDPAMGSFSMLVYSSSSVFNNIVHDLAPDAFAIYLDSGSEPAGITQYIYNNLVWNVGDHSPIAVASDATVPSNQFIYNNTFLGGASVGCVTVAPNYFPPTSLTVQNNHCISDLPSSQAWCWNNAGGSFNCGPVINLNFGNNVLMPTATATSQGYTQANSFQPTTPTGATVGAGLNLLSSCVTIGASLCADRLGVARPGGSTAWDAGAYQYQSVAGSLAPMITMQPLRQAVAAGHTAVFSVIAMGTAPLSYQWQENGSPISGATSSTYSSPAAQTSDDGALFNVVVTNSVGSVASSPALLTVNASAGQLVPDQISVGFGTVPIGTVSTVTVTLTNTSTAYTTISGASIFGAGFGASDLPTGIILAPGQAATMDLIFAPAGAGSAAGGVTITSNAAGSPTTIPLSGAGVVPPHSATITWIRSTSSVFGYFVYRATNQFGPYTTLNSTPTPMNQFTDITVQPGQTYLYWVTAVDSHTIQSVLSAPVSAVIPAP